MPFGFLCKVPAVFQRLMDLMLSRIRWEHCLVYIDDRVILGKAFKNHLQNLRRVLEKLRGAGLRLKPAKCSLFREKVIFLHGHVITGHGISTDPDKIDTVRKWSALLLQEKCNSSWDSLDILPSLHSRFLHDRDAPQFEWTSECDAALHSRS